MTELVMERTGPSTSIQDGGRRGWQRFGLSFSGALDKLALARANALAGNPPFAAALELLRFGLKLRVIGGDARLALAGADFPVTASGRTVPTETSFVLRSGELLEIGHCSRGVCGILAVEGGIGVEPMLGSASLHARGEVGGIDGRPLMAGDRLPLIDRPSCRDETTAKPPLPVAGARIRVVPGPQADHFDDAAFARFLASDYVVSDACDRMGYRLRGPAIASASGGNIISDGVVEGSIQIPASGQPIVMLADRQTTGGYPKIATVITADLGAFANRRPGETVRFEAISIEAAQDLLADWHARLADVPSLLAPAPSPRDWEGRLHMCNLVGGAVSACDPATWGQISA